MITLRKVFDEIQLLRRELRQMSDNFSTEVSQLQADVGTLKGAVDTAKQVIEGIPARIADAVQQAQAAGATDAQLQALRDLHTSLSAETADLQTVLTPPQQSSGTQPAGGGTDTTGGAGATPPAAASQPTDGSSAGTTSTDPSSGA